MSSISLFYFSKFTYEKYEFLSVLDNQIDPIIAIIRKVYPCDFSRLLGAFLAERKS